MPRKPVEIKNKNTNFEGMDRLKGFYKYPNEADFHPDSDLHKKLLSFILNAITESYNAIQERFDTWKELDEKLSVYVELDDDEKDIQDADDRKPVSIVVPISYATRESLLTYRVASFLNYPLFKYEASSDPRDTLNVLLLENMIANHCIRSKVALTLHRMWSDEFTYGYGIGSPTWRKEYAFRTNKETGVRDQIIKFEGNVLDLRDPYNTFPDPSVPVANVKKMNYFGYVDRTNYNALLKEEKMNPDEVFNVRFLETMGDRTSSFFSADSQNTGRYSKQNITFDRPDSGNQVSKPTDILELYACIIPDEYRLNESQYPELWKFRVASDRVIIGAQEANFDHDEIPAAVTSADSDGHVTLPVSILEREYPLQHSIDWLWQSHVANVRKAINNMFIADPSLVNMNDVTDTKYGMVARLRPSAWGRGVKDVLEQLPVNDVTKNHINDIGFLMQLDSLVFTSNQSKGVQDRRGERVSASEARDTRMSFLSRMEKSAKLANLQGHYDIAYQFASNTIQLIEEEQVVKLTGDYRRVLAEEYNIDAKMLKVSPESLQVGFDVIPNDGSLQGGEYADVWERLMNNAAAHPDLFQQVDFVQVWKHIARLLGAKNVGDFMKRPLKSHVQDEETLAERQRKGNIVNINEVGPNELKVR